jgi:hypothetical protein
MRNDIVAQFIDFGWADGSKQHAEGRLRSAQRELGVTSGLPRCATVLSRLHDPSRGVLAEPPRR